MHFNPSYLPIKKDIFNTILLMHNINVCFVLGPVMLDEFVEWLKASRATTDIS